MPFFPTRGQTHVDRPLTNMSVAIMQSPDNFGAFRIFPNLPVSKQSDRYNVYPRGYWNRAQMRKRGRATESAQAIYKIDNTPTYLCDVWALSHDIDDQERANYDDPLLGPDTAAVQLLTLQALLTKEKEWVSNFFKAGVWATDKTGVSGTPGVGEFKQWNDAASTPIEDIRAWKRAFHESTGLNPNKLSLGARVYDALLDHPDIIDRVKYGQTPGSPAMANKAILASLFEMEEVVVLAAIENTAEETNTTDGGATHAYIAGKGALLTHTPSAPGLMTPSAGYTITWTGYLGSVGPMGTEMSRYRIDTKKSDRYEIECAFDMKATATDLGLFAATAVA